MTDQMIQETMRQAIKFSKEAGHCYILSNGKELQVVVTAELKETLKEKGYWVAAIYENGHPVEA